MLSVVAARAGLGPRRSRSVGAAVPGDARAPSRSRDRPEPSAVAQAPAIGLGRVIASEYPRLRCKLVDLDPGADDGGLGSLFDEIEAADDEDEVALRGVERYVHRFLPAPGLPPAGDAARSRPALPYRLAIRRPGTLDGLVAAEARAAAAGPGRGRDRGRRRRPELQRRDEGAGDLPRPARWSRAARCRVQRPDHGGRRRASTDLRVGDEVLAVAGFAFGSHVVTRAELVALKPPRLSFEEAATLPIAFLTAAYALEYLGRLGPGETRPDPLGDRRRRPGGHADWPAAPGRRSSPPPARRRSASTCGRSGIDRVMDSRSLAFADEVLERTGGRGVDVILNSLAGEAIARGLAALADYGRFLEIGKRDIYQNARLGLQPFRKNLSFFAIDLDRVIRERPALLGALLRDIVRRVGEGELDAAAAPRLADHRGGRRLPLHAAGQAHRQDRAVRSASRPVATVPARGRAARLPRRCQLPDHGRPGRLRSGGRPLDGRARCRHLVLVGRARRRYARGPRRRSPSWSSSAPGSSSHAADVSQGSGRGRGAGRDRPRPAAAPRRAPRGDGPGRCPAAQPRPRPDATACSPRR